MTYANQETLALGAFVIAGSSVVFSTMVVPPPRPVLPPVLFLHKPATARWYYRGSTTQSTGAVLPPRSTGPPKDAVLGWYFHRPPPQLKTKTRPVLPLGTAVVVVSSTDLP
jgi:hypothetical protein